MAEFERAYAQVAAPAAGYTDGKQGRTGECYGGIARRFHPRWSGWRRIDGARARAGFPASLERDRYLPRMAKGFHRKQYWDRLAGDRLPHQGVAEALYRCAMEEGARRAVRLLQQSLNVLAAARGDQATLTVDGLPGEPTLRVLRAYRRREPGAETLLQIIELLRGGAHMIVTRRPRGRSLSAGT